MSAGAANLRRKIDGAGALQSVVRTMKALAASNIGQYEESLRALAQYCNTVELGLSACIRRGGLPPGRTQPRVRVDATVSDVVVFGSDQGLVGRFNDAVADHALKTLPPGVGKARMWAVGERVRARLVSASAPLAGLFAVPDSVDAIAPLVESILLKCAASHEDRGELHLCFNRPTVAAGYEPVDLRLLPLDESWSRGLSGVTWPTPRLPEVMGDRTSTLRDLIREHLFISIFRACTQSLASENASRLAAMQSAERNIDDLLEQLRGTFRRVRQSSIDEELFDVISGFQALSEGGSRRSAVP